MTRAIHLAHQDLLRGQVPLADVADAAWQLSGYCQDGATHDLALVTALYFLGNPQGLPGVPARPGHQGRLDDARRDARLRAQEWVTQGLASVGVVGRFEEALYKQAG